MKYILHFIVFTLLTIITQIGGLIYIISILLTRRRNNYKCIKRVVIFSILYLLSVFIVIPEVALFFGREKIKESNSLKAHSFFYRLANRDYVKPELNDALTIISNHFETKNKGIEVIYLDANFPFFDGFPLLPHLSHDDGKKIDVSLIYNESNGKLTNKKPSYSGYGVYESPKANEFNQFDYCKKHGNWQYDLPKYLTFGRINEDITLSESGTRQLAQGILNRPEIGKMFIEPHLKTRLNIRSHKVRFHGCHAVRHDDHIHFQLR